MFVRLEMIDDRHNKFYEVKVQRERNGYIAIAEYGRIPNTQASNVLYNGPDQEKAILLAREQIRKKIAKGYEIVEEQL